MKVLVTGGMGFIGSNFILHLHRAYPHYRIINLDLLTYAGNPANLEEIQSSPNYRFVHGDIADRAIVDSIMAEGVDAVVHFAAESHVDRSIENPLRFVHTNVTGTLQLLESARKHGVARFVQVSTDEVYGSLGPDGLFTERTPLAPNSPYSASKAGADLLARSYYETYGLPVIITRCSNNYGPRQFPEKLIPLVITRALEDREVPIYGDGLNVRDWLHVDDHCAAVDLALHRGVPGEVYNVGGNNERTNVDIVRRILAELGKPESLIRFVQDRPGHDRRYAIDATKIRETLGWSPRYRFDEGLKATIEWYVSNPEWWKRIRSGAYRQGDHGGTEGAT
jgi:dTDP-glucose 4,6-dehydratase